MTIRAEEERETLRTEEVRCHIRCRFYEQPNGTCTPTEASVQRLHKTRRKFIGRLRGLFANAR